MIRIRKPKTPPTSLRTKGKAETERLCQDFAADPAQRARCHTADLSAERPLLIHPGEEDPEAVMSFHGEIPFAVGGNARGDATIKSLGLDRPELNEMRLQWLNPLRVLHDVIQLAQGRPGDAELQSLAASARVRLEELRRDEAQYAGMVRAVLPGAIA